ncbi:MAG: NAD(P)H-dependent oxidoreductase subunit E [Planctomycetota bacterium]
MAWRTIDRTKIDPAELGPGLSDATLAKIRTFFPRYPTKRAALLPALHLAQDELGYVSLRAMREIAELLEIPPAAVMDVVTFYTHFWTHPKGRKTIVLCRSIACELMGGKEVRAALEAQLGIREHETTPDGEWSYMTEECLAACDFAPCMLINEKLHKNVRPEDVERILADPENDRLEIPRSDLYDAPTSRGRLEIYHEGHEEQERRRC